MRHTTILAASLLTLLALPALAVTPQAGDRDAGWDRLRDGLPSVDLMT